MKTVALSLLFAALPAWGHFCEHLLEGKGSADVAMEVETPAFVDTLEEMELPYHSIQLGHALGRELVRLGISLTDKHQLIAFLKEVLDGAFRQATLANGFDPFSTISIRLYLEPDRIIICFEDQARFRNNPWDSPERRLLTNQGTPVPAIWQRLIELDLPYYFMFAPGRGNIFGIAIDWDLAL